jgi:hypothetical protein
MFLALSITYIFEQLVPCQITGFIHIVNLVFNLVLEAMKQVQQVSR